MQNQFLENPDHQSCLLSVGQTDIRNLYDFKKIESGCGDCWSLFIRYVAMQALECPPIVMRIWGTQQNYHTWGNYPIVAEGGTIAFISAPLLEGGDLRLSDATLWGISVTADGKKIYDIPGGAINESDSDFVKQVKEYDGYVIFDIAPNRSGADRDFCIEFRTKEQGNFSNADGDPLCYRYYNIYLTQKAE